jgi:hypothetical protein
VDASRIPRKGAGSGPRLKPVNIDRKTSAAAMQKRRLQPNDSEGSPMADNVIDFVDIREAKSKKFDGYCNRIEMVGRRQRILGLAIREMEEFSSKEEIVKTLRFAIDVLEGRGG